MQQNIMIYLLYVHMQTEQFSLFHKVLRACLKIGCPNRILWPSILQYAVLKNLKILNWDPFVAGIQSWLLIPQVWTDHTGAAQHGCSLTFACCTGTGSEPAHTQPSSLMPPEHTDIPDSIQYLVCKAD